MATTRLSRQDAIIAAETAYVAIIENLQNSVRALRDQDPFSNERISQSFVNTLFALKLEKERQSLGAQARDFPHMEFDDSIFDSLPTAEPDTGTYTSLLSVITFPMNSAQDPAPYVTVSHPVLTSLPPDTSDFDSAVVNKGSMDFYCKHVVGNSLLSNTQILLGKPAHPAFLHTKSDVREISMELPAHPLRIESQRAFLKPTQNYLENYFTTHVLAADKSWKGAVNDRLGAGVLQDQLVISVSSVLPADTPLPIPFMEWLEKKSRSIMTRPLNERLTIVKGAMISILLQLLSIMDLYVNHTDSIVFLGYGVWDAWISDASLNDGTDPVCAELQVPQSGADTATLRCDVGVRAYILDMGRAVFVDTPESWFSSGKLTRRLRVSRTLTAEPMFRGAKFKRNVADVDDGWGTLLKTADRELSGRLWYPFPVFFSSHDTGKKVLEKTGERPKIFTVGGSFSSTSFEDADIKAVKAEERPQVLEFLYLLRSIIIAEGLFKTMLKVFLEAETGKPVPDREFRLDTLFPRPSIMHVKGAVRYVPLDLKEIVTGSNPDRTDVFKRAVELWLAPAANAVVGAAEQPEKGTGEEVEGEE